MTARHLIYTAAFGDVIFYEMAQECVASARRHGYVGDFFVLTDREHVFKGAECKVVPPASEALLSKTALTRVLHPKEIALYDNIFFIDSDCVFTAPPGRLLALGGLRLCAGAPLAEDSYNAVFLSDSERRDAIGRGVRQFNSGTVLMPGSRARDLLERWERAWRDAPREDLVRQPRWAGYKDMNLDQPALQAMLHRSGIAWSAFPRGTVAFPVWMKNSRALILHFCGPLNGGESSHRKNKEVVLGWMKAANSPRDAGPRKLLYTAAHGGTAAFLSAHEMILSARRRGFEGDIAVLTDRPWDFPGGAATYPLDEDAGRFWPAALPRALDPGHHPEILYVQPVTIFDRDPGAFFGGNPPVAGAVSFQGSEAREFLAAWERRERDAASPPRAPKG